MADESVYTTESTESFLQEYAEIFETSQEEYSTETVVFDETVNNQLEDIKLCLIVIIFSIAIASGVLLGSILWGRIRK